MPTYQEVANKLAKRAAELLNATELVTPNGEAQRRCELLHALNAIAAGAFAIAASIERSCKK